MSLNGLAPHVTLTLAPDSLEELVAEVTAHVLAEIAKQPSGGRWLRGNAAAAEYLDAALSRVEYLASRGLMPVHKDGSANVFHTAELDAWVRAGGAKRW